MTLQNTAKAVLELDNCGQSILEVSHRSKDFQAVIDEADAFFPAINPDEWQQLNCERHDADERNPYAYDFVTLVRKNGQPLAHPQVG